MRDRPWLAPLTGLAFVILTFVVFAFGEPPDAEDAREVVDFYVDNRDSQVAAAMLEGIAATLLVFFGAVLRRVLAGAEGDGGILAAAAFGGTIVFATGLAIDATLTFALAETADEIDLTAVQALTALWHNDFVPFAVGLQLLLLATGIGIVRYGVLPKWIGWVAIVLAVLALTPIGFVAFIGSAIVIAVMSIMLALRTRSVQPAAPTA